MNKLPKISIVMPVLNEERDIKRCLESIKKQEYPKDLLEVIVADGGSTDDTRQLVEDFGYTLIDNPEKLAEPGMALATETASGDLVVNMAADNYLRESDWLIEMAKPFQENPEVMGAICRVECDEQDDPFLKYFNSDTDPFSAFFYSNASHPDKFKRIYPVKKETESYAIYKYNAKNYPLIAFAQGFVIRKSYNRPKQTTRDDVLPIIDLITNGNDIAYVKTVTIGHNVFDNFRHYRRRMLRKVSESFTDPGHGFHVRENHMTTARRIRQYLFVPYGLTVIFPFLRSLGKFLTTGKLYHFYEVPASFLLALYIVYLFIVVRVLKTVDKPLDI